MSVKVEHLVKVYEEQKAVDDISFEVGSGEVLGFLGPNGAGKTTTMKIITCFIPQTEGKASVCGYDINKQPMQVKEQIGYLPENNPLYPDMYVKEYLEFAAGLHKLKKDSKKRIDDIIGLTGLAEEQKKKIGQLSKGYRQRVGLAQAMLHNPRVLILDEPTSGLDPNQVVEIRKIIKDLGKEKTVILCTHIMQEVQAMCSRVIIINKGKIIADDKTSKLQQKVSGTRTFIIEFDKDIAEKALQKIEDISHVVPLGGSKYKLSYDKAHDLRPVIFDLAVEKGLKLLTMQEETQSLEDVFRKLTK